MPKHLLVGINAKYIHTNLAIRSIAQYAKENLDFSIAICEYTINQQTSTILSELYKQSPDSIGFSCYIWNYNIICHLTTELKKILPNCKVYFGGPEVSYNPAQVLEHTDTDFVVCGEGEQTVPTFLQALDHGADLRTVPNLAFRDGTHITVNHQAPLLSMDVLPFVYDNLDSLAHKIIYYESSRGCPFQCQYCLSSIDHGVRMMSLARVYSHLDFFLSRRVRQVKFVDRTFNADPAYAMAIWRYLDDHDNGYTNFHFEIAAELLTEEALAFLPAVRKGFFQFEIGVQSTNPPTLKAIRRFTKIDRLRDIVAKLKAGQNIHLHLDLIVGLPHESVVEFRESFNAVHGLAPDQLQVGFLKLLKGSGLYQNQAEYGLTCSPFPPYEVLYTKDLPYGDLLHLKMVEEMVEVYYNSNRFQRLLDLLVPTFDSAFDCFSALASYFEAEEHHLRAHTNVGYYNILWEFVQDRAIDLDDFKACALFDLYSHEKVKKLPDWLDEPMESSLKKQIFNFYECPQNRADYLAGYEGYDTKQLIRGAHILRLNRNPFTKTPVTCYYLFNYKCCDLLGNADYYSLPADALEGEVYDQSESRSPAR